MKKNLYQIHKVSGLTLGIFLFLLAVSGVLITFREEVMPLVYPQFRVSPLAAHADLKLLMTNAQGHLGERMISNFYAAEGAEDAALILFKGPGASLPGILTMNPYTGKVIGEMAIWQNVFAVALFFHANFFLGTVGETIVGILGLVLVLFAVSGFIIWLPKLNRAKKLKALLSLKGKRDPQRLHHLLGLILALPLVLSGVTGFLMVFDLSYSMAKVVKNEPQRPPELLLQRDCRLSEDLEALSLLTPGQKDRLISIHFCGKKNAYVRASFGLEGEGYGRILLDSRTRTIVQRFDSSKDPSSWNIKRLFIYPLHSGELLGLPGRILVLLGGLGLMGLFISGLTLYYRRLRTKRSIYVQTIIPKEI